MSSYTNPSRKVQDSRHVKTLGCSQLSRQFWALYTPDKFIGCFQYDPASQIDDYHYWRLESLANSNVEALIRQKILDLKLNFSFQHKQTAFFGSEVVLSHQPKRLNPPQPTLRAIYIYVGGSNITIPTLRGPWIRFQGQKEFKSACTSQSPAEVNSFLRFEAATLSLHQVKHFIVTASWNQRLFMLLERSPQVWCGSIILRDFVGICLSFYRFLTPSRCVCKFKFVRQFLCISVWEINYERVR